MIVLKITLSAAVCQMTNVSGLDDFVTESGKLAYIDTRGGSLLKKMITDYHINATCV
jgi:hypothetical protein